MKEVRIKRVLSEMKAIGLSQILIVDPRSIYYLTDVDISPYERFLGLYLSTKKDPVLFLNKLFTIPENLNINKVWHSDTDSVCDMISAVIDTGEILGVDKNIQARFLLPLIEHKAAEDFVIGSYAVDITRGIKDSEEQKRMRISSEINDRVMGACKSLVCEGVTEKQIADQMHQIYLDFGAEDYSFTPIVSFGANAADPHHMPDDTVLKTGDCVLFDIGGKKGGYCSDMTRTFFFQEVSEHCRSIYNLVKEANEAAEALIRPGIPLKDLDAAARSHITDAGYGPNFNHRLGHFIGLDEHEYGDISSASEWIAKPGMIFSIEPGIYIPGDTGVRIEDLVLVTETGVEILNHFDKNLEVIG